MSNEFNPLGIKLVSHDLKLLKGVNSFDPGGIKLTIHASRFTKKNYQ